MGTLKHFSIEQINVKDEQAFHLLYLHYYQILVYYSMQIVETKEEAEDIVQELFTNIWDKNIQFKTEESFLSYLYNSIRNSSINYLRHKNVEESYVQKMMENFREYNGSDDDDNTFEMEIYRMLFKTIEALPSRCKEVFLQYMDGKKNDEIAKALNVSIETVKTQKKRAVMALKKRLSSYDFFVIFLLMHQ